MFCFRKSFVLFVGMFIVYWLISRFSCCGRDFAYSTGPCDGPEYTRVQRILIYTSARMTLAVCLCIRAGHSATAGHRQRSSESNSAARWRRVAAVCGRRTAHTARLLVQERTSARVCRTRPAIRDRRLRHPPDFQ